MYTCIHCNITYTAVSLFLQVLTKDSVTVFVDAVVYYKIFDPIVSSTNIRDAGWATRLLSQTMLRNVLGAHSLSETMTNRDLLAGQLQVCVCV